MKTIIGDFDLIMTKKYCDILANDTSMFLPITMTLEECIEICCEQTGKRFIEIVKVTGRDSNGNCEGEFSYEY